MSTVTQTVLRQRGNEAQAAAKSNSSPVTTTPITVNGRLVQRVPSTKPAFSLSDIRRAIPAHCFERNLVTSFGYVLYDLSIIAALFYLATKIETIVTVARFGSLLTPLLQHALWICYWICQGSVMTGMWVIGHECGHGGFANTTLMNDIVGWTIHSLLLVPYFSWQISHRKHHSNTASLEHDEVFVPKKLEQISSVEEAKKDDDDRPLIAQLFSSLYRSLRIFFMLTVGWPLYLFTNATGNQTYSKDAWVNHFSLNSPIYADIRNGSTLVLLSDIGLLLVVAGLAVLSHFYSFGNVAYYYLLPYLVTNLFLVLITFLQHTDQALPHYDATEWDWLRGALATIDRDYGILNSVFHHITDTHVVHHLFSSMPHYHAMEATEAVKAVLGPYYIFDSTPVATALWQSYGECVGVKACQKQSGVFWY